MPSRPWQDAEIEYLVASYGKIPAKAIGESVNRTSLAISHKATRLDLRSNIRLRNIDRTKQRGIRDLLEVEKAYMAGFLDGDGSFTFRTQGRGGQPTYTPIIIFSNKDTKLLETLRAWVGGHISRRNDCSNLNVLRLRDVEYLAEAIQPYLILKKHQSELLLEYCKIRLMKPIYERVRFTERENQIYKELRQLNSKTKGRVNKGDNLPIS